MSHRIDDAGVVYDLDTGGRIGVVDNGRGGIVLDEDAYRDDGRYGDVRMPVWDVSTEVPADNAHSSLRGGWFVCG